MTAVSDTAVRVRVADADYKRLLGYPRDYALSGRAAELSAWAAGWYEQNGRPWMYARQAASLEPSSRSIQIEGGAFHCDRLQRILQQAGAGAAMLAAVSAGPEAEEEADRLWREEKPDEYYFLDRFASCVTEQLITDLGVRLCGWAEEQGMAVLPHYSPGYSGWDVGEQPRLFSLLGTELPGRLEVLDSGALRPKKSLLAVFGLTRNTASLARLTTGVPCARCSFHPCQYRRVPTIQPNGRK